MRQTRKRLTFANTRYLKLCSVLFPHSRLRCHPVKTYWLSPVKYIQSCQAKPTSVGSWPRAVTSRARYNVRLPNKSPDRDWPLVPGDRLCHPPGSSTPPSSPSMTQETHHLHRAPQVIELTIRHYPWNENICVWSSVPFWSQWFEHYLTDAMHNVRHYFCKSITFTDYSLPYLFDHNHIKYLKFSRIHKTLINVLTDSSQFQERKRREGWREANSAKVWTLTQCDIHQ